MSTSRRVHRPRSRMRDREQRDPATRERIVAAATQRFADHGFNNVKVRDICRDARANIAAVNYHFGGKLGLYREVVRAAIDAIRETGDASTVTPPGMPPAERLRHYVRTYVPRLASRDSRVAWIHNLMRHEMSEPTPLATWIAEQAILPRITYLTELVAELLECPVSDRRVMWCVASIHAQCLIHAPNRFYTVAFKDLTQTPPDLDAIADHIADFSLAGIERVASLGVDFTPGRSLSR